MRAAASCRTGTAGHGAEEDERMTAPRFRRAGLPGRGSMGEKYVQASLTAEIDAFAAAAETMRRKLSELDPAQRAEVEEASRILRRARAARPLPLTDITSRATETA